MADALTATGLPNPGPVTNYGLPFVRAAGEIAAVVAVGSFLLAAFLVPPQTNGVLDVAGYRALRTGTVASGVWAVCAVLLVPLTVSDVTGQPLTSRLSPSGIWSVASLIDTAGTWRWTALFAAIVTVVSIPVLRWSWTPLLFARRARHPAAARAERALVGRRLARPGHQQPAHPPGRRCGVGGRPAGAAGARVRGGEHADLAAGGSPRSRCGASWRWRCRASSTRWCGSASATWCDSGYGWLIIGKAVALCVLGVIGLAAAAARSGRAGSRSRRPGAR